MEKLGRGEDKAMGVVVEMEECDHVENNTDVVRRSYFDF